MEIDEFVLRHVFHRIPAGTDSSGRPFDELYWREVKGGGEGYILLWPPGKRHHTYHHPEKVFGPSEDE